MLPKCHKSKTAAASRHAEKIVPPKSFHFNTPKIQDLLQTLNIPHPLEQRIQVGRGFYDLKLIQRKGLSCSDYKKLVDNDSRVIRGMTPNDVERHVG